MSFVSVRTRENFSPARNVRSTTAPLSSPFSLVRTNAPPLPGFTCWKSTMRHTPPSSSMCIPFLNWFVLTVSAMKRKLADRDQVLAEPGEVVDAVGRHHDVVLDPDAGTPLEIDPRLDRDDVARRQRVGRLRRHPRRLMHLEAETVAETVAECPCERRLVDDAACRSVGVDAGDPGADRVERRLLCREHDRVRLLHDTVDRTGHEGARVIGGVAVDDAPGVDDNGLACADLAIGRACVRARRLRPGRDDALERDGVGTLVMKELLDRPRNFAFRAPDEALLRQALEHPVGQLAGTSDRRELLLVLDRPQPFDEASPRDGLDCAGAERLPRRIGKMVSLEADRPRQALGEVPQERAARLLEAYAVDCTRRLRIAKVREEPNAVGLDEQRSVRALEAEQVLDVDRIRNEEWFLERRAQPVDP